MTSDITWDGIPAAVPLLLLPIRIETRSDGDGALLRVRCYPDDIHVDRLDRGLTKTETAAGERYWLRRWRHISTPGTDDEWQELVRGVGSRRASWVATRTRPLNYNPPGNPPIFGTPDAADPEHRAMARMLPDCFHVVVDQGGETSTATGSAVDHEALALSAPTSLGANGATVTESLRSTFDTLSGRPDADADPKIRWLTDYQAAVDVGMAVTVELARPGEHIDSVYVLGVRDSESAEDSLAGFSALLEAHAYTDGAAFVAAGTPTNNIGTAATARPAPPQLPGHPPIRRPAGPDQGDAVQVFTALTGFPEGSGVPGWLSRIDGAALPYDRHATAFATVLWPVTWGAFLDHALLPTATGSALPVEARDAIRDHAIACVRGRGPLPMLRIGKQPYGLLPTSDHDSWVRAGTGRTEDAVAVLLRRVRPAWRAASTTVPTVTTGDLENDLPRILGQLPYSRGIRVRSAATTGEAELLAPGLGADYNTSAQQLLTRTLIAMTGSDPSGWHTPDALGDTTRILGLPMAAASDPKYCELLHFPPPHGGRDDPESVLQALFGLAEAAARHDAEELAVRERWSRLQIVWWPAAVNDGFLDPAMIDRLNHWVDILENTEEPWDNRDEFAELAQQLEDHEYDGPSGPARIGPFDPARYVARYPIAVQRPHSLLTVRNAREAVRTTAGAFRVLQRFAEIRSAIAEVVSIDDDAERGRLLADTVDCATHRLDAWLTSVVTARLAGTRDHPSYTRGSVVGAFGWTHDITIETPTEAVDVSADDGGVVFEAQRDGGFVLAPSPAHATTAGVLLGARLTHDPEDDGDGALNIDLSSTRVRAALAVLDGMRAGQPLGALLGYRLERWMHEAAQLPVPYEIDRFIYCLRATAPLVAAKSTQPAAGPVPNALESVAATNVVDGVRLLELWRQNPTAVLDRCRTPPAGYGRYFTPWTAPTVYQLGAISGVITRLDRLHDAVADLLLAESVHQLCAGSPARASAAMDALAGDALPPPPDVVVTPQSGVALTHRVMVLLPWWGGAATAGWTDGSVPVDLSDIDPTHPEIEVWAREALGPAGDIILAPPAAGAPAVTLAAAGMSAVEFLGAATTDPTVFLGRLARRIPGLVGAPIPEDGSFAAAWAVAGSLARLLSGSRPASPADLLRPGDVGTAETRRILDVTDLRARAADAVTVLDAVRGLPAGIVCVDALAVFGIGADVDAGALDADGAAAHEKLVTDTAGARSGAATAALGAFDATEAAGGFPSDEARLKALGAVVAAVHGTEGGGIPFAGYLRTPHGDADPFMASAVDGVPATEGGVVRDGRHLRPWITRYARVRPAVARFAETLALRQALGRHVTLGVAQLADDPSRSWIGLPFPEGAGPPDTPVSSVVFDADPTRYDPTSSMTALVVDQWTEVVPRRAVVRDPGTGEPTGTTREITTVGLAVNANGPNSRAPQSVLLAVNPDMRPWSRDKVVGILTDTLQLVKERAAALEQVPLIGRLLPAIYVADWSMQGEPVLDLQQLYDADATGAVLPYVAEKD